MADGDTQLSYEPTSPLEGQSDDDQPVSVPGHIYQHDKALTSHGDPTATSLHSQSSESKRRKIDVENFARGPSASSPSAVDTSAFADCFATSSQTKKASNRVKAREAQRRANNLMDCFTDRAAAKAVASASVLKKPASSVVSST